MFDTLFVGGRRAGWLAGSLGCFRNRQFSRFGSTHVCTSTVREVGTWARKPRYTTAHWRGKIPDYGILPACAFLYSQSENIFPSCIYITTFSVVLCRDHWDVAERELHVGGSL